MRPSLLSTEVLRASAIRGCSTPLSRGRRLKAQYGEKLM